MAKYGSADVGAFLVDGYDILGYATDVTVDKEADLEETHTLGDAWVEQTPTGLSRWMMEQSGFYDDDTGASNEALVGPVATDRVIALCPNGNVIGDECIFGAAAVQANYRRILSRGALHKAEATFRGDGALYTAGAILHELSQETADGDTESTSVDESASSSDGGVAVLQVTELTLDGYDDISVDVIDSPDDAVYSSLISFTAVTAHPAAEFLTVSGSVDRYVASNWAFTGTGTSPTCSFLVGWKRN